MAKRLEYNNLFNGEFTYTEKMFFYKKILKVTEKNNIFKKSAFLLGKQTWSVKIQA